MIGIAVIYLLFGLAMLLVPQFQERYIIYIAGLLFLICGVIMIVKYFMAASYNDLGNYGFSGGVLCILLGSCSAGSETQQIAGYLPLFLGVCLIADSSDQIAECSGFEKPQKLVPGFCF